MKIGIVVAMEKELQPFIENRTYNKSVLASTDFYTLELGGNELIVAKLPHIGEICAASVTQMLISNFGVEMLINFGVVGGLTESASLLSTMVVSGVVHYEMDTTAIDNCKVGQYMLYDDVIIPTDKKLLELVHEIDPTLPQVICASGDKFIEDSSAKANLNGSYGAVICDMESAGIVITAGLSNVPVLLVKCVSDSLTGGAGEFMDNVYLASCQYVQLVEKLLGRMN